jgi:hypothetical protein
VRFKHLSATNVDGRINRRRETTLSTPKTTSPAPPKGEEKSSRESERLVAHATPTNYSITPRSNREKELGLRVATTKGTIAPNSNREKTVALVSQNSLQFWKAHPASRNSLNGRQAIILPALKPNLAQHKTQRKRKNTQKHPSMFVSVRKKSVLYFLQVTKILNDTMFRLERNSMSEQKSG